MFRIAQERAEDTAHADALVMSALGPGQFARAAWRVREACAAPAEGLSFVAWVEDKMAGAVRFWPIRIGDTPALLLGPLAVASDYRGAGAGRALVAHGCEAARAAGHRLVLLVGDMSYYGALGFEPVPKGLQMPGPVHPARLLWRVLAPNATDNAKGSVIAG